MKTFGTISKIVIDGQEFDTPDIDLKIDEDDPWGDKLVDNLTDEEVRQQHLDALNICFPDYSNKITAEFVGVDVSKDAGSFLHSIIFPEPNGDTTITVINSNTRFLSHKKRRVRKKWINRLKRQGKVMRAVGYRVQILDEV